MFSMGLIAIDNPPNPFDSEAVEFLEGWAPRAQLTVLEDRSRSILSKNDSPDVGFDWSVNPYRGCFHGCIYCYARPSHEYLSMGAGTDFERKIVIKPEAAALLEAAFEKKTWKGDHILFSGITDCYQPLEAAYGLTRSCLEVCARYRNPVSIITKSPLIERDLDVLLRLKSQTRVTVTVSIPVLGKEKARVVEPYVANPTRRLKTIRVLSEAGIPTGINIAPMIPGLSDEDIPSLLRAAKAAGAQHAGFIFLRLPGSVKSTFTAGLQSGLPLKAERVLSLLRQSRGGKLNDPRFGSRMAGAGPYAESVKKVFDTWAERLGLVGKAAPPEATTFCRPTRPGTQLSLL